MQRYWRLKNTWILLVVSITLHAEACLFTDNKFGLFFSLMRIYIQKIKVKYQYFQEILTNKFWHPNPRAFWGHVQSCLLKSNRLCLFLSFIYICIQKIKVRRESIRSRDIDDYRIVLCSWNYPQFQLRLRLLFDFSKKKINSQKLIWSFLIFEEYTPKCT